MGQQSDQRELSPWLRIALELLLFAACLLVFSDSGGCLVLSQEAQIPPDILMVNGKACKIDPQPGRKWAATCTASYLNHENYHHEPWVVKFPQRKSIADCGKDVQR